MGSGLRRATIYVDHLGDGTPPELQLVLDWLDRWQDNVRVVDYSTGGWEHSWNVEGPVEAITELPPDLLCDVDWANSTPSHKHSMTRPRLIRGLRIAWSVSWGILCVLLVVLWVQSYWWFNHAQYILSNNRVVALIAAQGVVSIFGGTAELADKSITSSIGSKKITFETDYWKSQHWNFEFGEAFKEARVPLWFLVAMCGVISTVHWLPWRFSLRTLWRPFNLHT